MPPVVLPIAEYMPDQPDLIGKGSSNILNVYPRTAISYGAVNSPAATSFGALGARCQGGTAVIDSTAAVYIFAGTTSDLYNLQAGLASWANVSKVPGGYMLAADGQWQFTYFNGDVVACQITDNAQFYTLGGGVAFADLAAAAPRARYLAVVKNAFLVFVHTYDGVNGTMPQRVWWSAAGNHRNWPTVGTNAAAEVQSGAVDLLGPLGWVMGIAADLANADAAVFQQYGVRRMMYVGPPDIFTMLPVENARGTPAPYSIVSYGGIAYYLGQDGFYAFDGGSSEPIGAERVDKTFFSMLDLGNIHRVIGTADPLKKLIWWVWPGPNNIGGNPNYALLYNIQLKRWSLVQITCETMLRMLSAGYTLDQLFTLLGYTLDTLPAPLDSPIWQGGALNLGIFDTTHTLSYLTGNPLAATVESDEIQPVPGRRMFVRNARPFVDGALPIPTVAIGHRERMQDAVTYTNDSALNSLGTCPVRASGRYLRSVTKIPQLAAGSNPTWTNISGVELDAVAQGAR